MPGLRTRNLHARASVPLLQERDALHLRGRRDTAAGDCGGDSPRRAHRRKPTGRTSTGRGRRRGASAARDGGTQPRREPPGPIHRPPQARQGEGEEGVQQENQKQVLRLHHSHRVGHRRPLAHRLGTVHRRAVHGAEDIQPQRDGGQLLEGGARQRGEQTIPKLHHRGKIPRQGEALPILPAGQPLAHL